MTAELIIHNINYIGSAFLFVIGLYTVLTHPNLIKKLIGLNIMETSLFLLFVSVGYVQGGHPPIIGSGQAEIIYVNPLPSALILTGIVVSVSITAYGLSLIIKIYDTYKTINLDEIINIQSQKHP